jgi:gas vesicle structural protein
MSGGGRNLPAELDGSEQLVLSDLINRVLDKGVVIKSNIIISIADIDLIQLELNLLISSIATAEKRKPPHDHIPVRTAARP